MTIAKKKKSIYAQSSKFSMCSCIYFYLYLWPNICPTLNNVSHLATVAKVLLFYGGCFIQFGYHNSFHVLIKSNTVVE